MAADSAQYAIDIAAKMIGGDQTIAQLDTLTESLLAGGKDAAYFSEAIARTKRELDVAASAVQVANAGLTEGQTRYAQLEKAAEKASKAADKAARSHGGVVPVDLWEAAQKAEEALAAEVITLRALEGEAQAAASKHANLNQQLKNLGVMSSHVNKRLGGTVQNTGKLAGALSAMGGPLGVLSARVLAPVKGFSELTEAFGKQRAMSLALAAGIAIVTAALVAGAAALAGYGIAMANQARSANLAAEAFAATSAEAAASVSVWTRLTNETGVSSQRLRELTKSLKDAKVSAAEMPAALQAVATAEAALGQGGASEFIAELSTAKKSVRELSDDVQQKFGGVVAKQMLSLEAQGARLKGNVARLFGGLDIEPFLLNMGILTDLFDENTTAGKTLKFLFETLVQPLVNGITAAIPIIEGFILGFMIGVLKMYIALQPLVKSVADFLGFNDPTTEETFKRVASAGEIAAYVVGSLTAVMIGFALRGVVMAVAGAVTYIAQVGVMTATTVVSAATIAGAWVATFVSFAASVVTSAAASVGAYLVKIGVMVASTATAAASMVASFVAMAAPMILPVLAIAAVVAAVAGLVYAIVKFGPQILDAVMSFIAPMVDVGKQIIAGLAKGITGAAGVVVDAVKGAISGAIKAAKSLLGIASPSKLFASFGEFTGEGYAIGVEDETPAAHAAMEELVSPPDVEGLAASPLASMTSPIDRATDSLAASGSAPAAAPAGQGVNLSNVQFVFNGVEGAEDAEGRLREMFTQLISGTLTQAGGVA